MAELPSSTSSSQKGMVGAQPCEEPGGLPVGQVWMWSLGLLHASSLANEFKPECLKGLVSLAVRGPWEVKGKLEAFCAS